MGAANAAGCEADAADRFRARFRRTANSTSTAATINQAPKTRRMIVDVLYRWTPANTATAMMNPASIRKRGPKPTGTAGS